MGAQLNRGKSKQDYQTPEAFIQAVLGRLGIADFAYDLAASPENFQSTAGYYNEEQNSLAQNWAESFKYDTWLWLNPPFSDIRPWVEKCWKESEAGAKIAVLVPASVGSNWWQEFVHHKAHVLMLNDRIQFVGAKWVYPKDCGLLLYTPFIRQGGYESWAWKPTS